MEDSKLHFVDWSGFIRSRLENAREHERRQHAQWGAARLKSFTNKSAGSVGAPPGDVRVRTIRRVLDTYDGFARSDAQKSFHDAFTKAIMPHIYGAGDFERFREKILSDNGMVRVNYEILVCTPRRFGKTTAVSMWCAALLACVPDMWISVFSTGQRASSSLLDQTAKFFRMLEVTAECRGGDENILKKNQEELFTRGAKPSDVRRMFSYPSTVSGLKGVGGKVIIMEEASRIDEQVFKEVILPLTAVQDTVLIGISTPLDENNFYSMLLDMKKPSGDLLFNQLTISLLCDACLAAGLMSCPHRNALPAWKSGERQEVIASLMAGDKAMFMRENLGIITKTDNSAFERASIDRLWARKFSLASAAAPQFVYVCIDPCGGGVSAMALAACFFTPSNHLVIAGADAQVVQSDAEQERFIHGFLDKLRECPPLQRSHLVVIVERNYGGAPLSSRIARICSPYPPCSAMSQDRSPNTHRVGVVTTNEVKERMRITLSTMMRSDTVHLATPFIGRRQEARDEVITQLRGYSFVIKETSDPHRPPKVILSGKGAGKQDDLAIACQMCSLWPMTHQGDGPKCLIKI